MMSGSFVSIFIWISNLCAESFAPVREMTIVGRPLVSLRVEHRCRYPDTLLAPGLADLVKPRAVEEFAKDIRHLHRDDTGTVVFDNNPENIVPGFFDADVNIGKHLRLLAGIERVIHGFLDRGDNATGW